MIDVLKFFGASCGREFEYLLFLRYLVHVMVRVVHMFIPRLLLCD